jgi:hypothetical protein
MSNENDFNIVASGNNQPAKAVNVEAAISRQAQEVQAAMVIAKKFPRDENEAYARIMKACQRKCLAEGAIYEYPRGTSKVSGPSIRLAEVLAQSWGNIDFGIVELEQRNGESTIMAYAWDLETNTRQTKIFQVKHERMANGSIKKLVDPRDIYEMTANQGARRVRACILGIIPGDIVDAATEACEKTMANGETEPLSDRIRKMASVFKNDFGVSQEMIEARFGHNIDSISESEMVTMKKIYRALKDNMGSVEDHFKQVSKFEAKEEPAKTKATKKTPVEEVIKDAEVIHDVKSSEITKDTIVQMLKEANAPVTFADIEAYMKQNENLPFTIKLEELSLKMQMVYNGLNSIVNKTLTWLENQKK